MSWRVGSAHCCFSPDRSFNQVSKTTLDGEKWIGWGKKKSTSPRITSSLVMIYPVPLLILQLSKSTLYAWMAHGLYLNQINVSATSDRSSAQPLEWQVSKVHVFPLLPFSSSLQTLYHERSADKACFSDDCYGILLVKRLWEASPPTPAPVKPTLSVCGSWVWMTKTCG